jgi:CO dehydrogenase maturation factor
MGLFHCPMGAPFYDDEACIDCGMCSATTKEAMIEASKKIRDYLRSHTEKKGAINKIAVAGKGGVGKSTVITLMANVLKRRGYHVLVLDADESNPGLYRMFGFDQEPKPLMALLSRFSVGEPEPNTGWLIRERIDSQDIPSEYILDHNGLRFLMVGKIVDPFQGCACSMADIAKDLVAKLVLKDKELLLIDMEAGIESFGRGMERSVNTILIVVEPSYESLALAEKISYMAEGMGISWIRAILNKVPSEEVKQRMIEELDKRSIKPIGTIYFDPQLNKAGFEGTVLGDSKATLDMEVIMDLLVDESK